MKTSNKLLLGLCAFIGLTLISGMGIARKNMVLHDRSKIDLSGNPKTKVLAESYESLSLVLNEKVVDHYTLDPNLSSISISAEEKIAEQFRVSDEGKVRFYTEGDRPLEYNGARPVIITIGVKGKEALSVQLERQAKLDNIAVLKSDLVLSIEDQARATIQYEGKNLKVLLSDSARLRIEGSVDELDVQTEDQTRLQGSEFTVAKLKVKMENAALIKLNSATHIEGELEDNAVLHFEQACEANKVRKQDRSMVTFSIDG